jgi:hypothetical protein
LEALVELGPTPDSTTVSGHSQAAGAKGTHKESFGRSRGGVTTKIHARADSQGRPLDFVRLSRRPDLLAMPLNKPRRLLADKADSIHPQLLFHGTRPIIPPRAGRKTPPLPSLKGLAIATFVGVFKPLLAQLGFIKAVEWVGPT